MLKNSKGFGDEISTKHKSCHFSLVFKALYNTSPTHLFSFISQLTVGVHVPANLEDYPFSVRTMGSVFPLPFLFLKRDAVAV